LKNITSDEIIESLKSDGKEPKSGQKAPEIKPESRVVKKKRNSLAVEQVVQYSGKKGCPVVSAEIRLTTAWRGQRKHDGMSETGYLMRLEILGTSGEAKVEGFSLGPWQVDNLKLETGSIYISEPIWAGFQPFAGVITGRLLINDTERNQLLDLPWKTEGIVPGPEPCSG
jgi:hypothetical protein